MWNKHGVVGKTGFAGPLIRPTGTFSPRGEEGIERSRHVPSPRRRGSEGRVETSGSAPAKVAAAG
ncbi:hypothetical protein GFL78_37240 [Rhizobium leguminosarum bv. viciae]|nr:hypothetical protein [Rhizobium leguminosarum bv. viciae]